MSPILGIYASQISGHLYAASYESIATTTLGSPASSITFSSIPQTYTHLQIRFIGRSSSGSGTSFDYCYLSPNGNGGATVYSDHTLYGNGTSALAAARSSNNAGYPVVVPQAGITAGVFASGVIDILDYKNTNKYKTVRALSGYDANGSGIVTLGSLLDTTNTNAITSIVFGNLGTWATGSTFALYGIKDVA